ncbi:hypothetical protein N9R79_08955 [Vibrio sp.]|nr:hypothetical protein [Vibrio sp.]
MKIAIFVPHRNFFGNVLTQIPFVQAVRQRHPESHITLWTKCPLTQVLHSVGLTQAVIQYGDMRPLELLRAVNVEQYDVVYNIYKGSDKVHFVIGLSNAKKKYGYSGKSIHKLCYDKHIIITQGEQYAGTAHMKLFNAVHTTNHSVHITNQLVSLPPEEQQPQQLTLLPGGGAGEFKKWPIEQYLTLAQNLLSNPSLSNTLSGANLIVGPDEADYATRVPAEWQDRIQVIISPSVQELIDIGAQSRLVVANDCGPSHIFQMLERPMITLWGWATPDNPPSDTVREWLHRHENAIPILADSQSQSIKSISIDSVETTARQLLKSV